MIDSEPAKSSPGSHGLVMQTCSSRSRAVTWCKEGGANALLSLDAYNKMAIKRELILILP